MCTLKGLSLLQDSCPLKDICLREDEDKHAYLVEDGCTPNDSNPLEDACPFTGPCRLDDDNDKCTLTDSTRSKIRSRLKISVFTC